MKTARALGLNIRETITQTAKRVIRRSLRMDMRRLVGQKVRRIRQKKGADTRNPNDLGYPTRKGEHTAHGGKISNMFG